MLCYVNKDEISEKKMVYNKNLNNMGAFIDDMCVKFKDNIAMLEIKGKKCNISIYSDIWIRARGSSLERSLGYKISFQSIVSFLLSQKLKFDFAKYKKSHWS